MKIGARKKGNVEILDLPKRLLHAGGDELLREKFKAALESGQRLFILNMTKVSSLDSATIGETVACLKRARERGGVVKIVAKPAGRPDQLLRLTAMDRIFEIFGDEKEALATFNR